MPNRLKQWMRSFAFNTRQTYATKTTKAPGELRLARSALLHCVEDCPEDSVLRLQLKIQSARSHQELWALRSEVYHCVAMQHHQATASERVKAVAHHFEGWMEPAEVRHRTR